jgi:hypothetical protein
MVLDLLVVADVCIEGSEARAWLLESHNKGPSKKKRQEDQEVNTGDHGYHNNCRKCQQQFANQKEKKLFW